LNDEALKVLAAQLYPPKVEDVEPQIDRAAELQKKWNTARGDLWEIASKSVAGKCHRILCGDSTNAEDVQRVMRGEKAQAVVTDSPYGIGREGIANDNPVGLRVLFGEVVQNLPVENAVIVNFQSPRLFTVWLDSIREHGHKFERMLWLYAANNEAKPWRGWILKSESILISTFGKGQWNEVKPYSHDCYYVTSVGNELPKDWGKTHTSVKPLSVVSDLARRVCPDGAIVFDPFLGSGTTLVACEQTGRIGRGIEIEPKYVAVCLERLSVATGKTPELMADGG
jgi:site-specific DNA-methyltransferase (adenine-specific)